MNYQVGAGLCSSWEMVVDGSEQTAQLLVLLLVLLFQLLGPSFQILNPALSYDLVLADCSPQHLHFPLQLLISPN